MCDKSTAIWQSITLLNVLNFHSLEASLCSHVFVFVLLQESISSSQGVADPHPPTNEMEYVIGIPDYEFHIFVAPNFVSATDSAHASIILSLLL